MIMLVPIPEQMHVWLYWWNEGVLCRQGILVYFIMKKLSFFTGTLSHFSQRSNGKLFFFVHSLKFMGFFSTMKQRSVCWQFGQEKGILSPEPSAVNHSWYCFEQGMGSPLLKELVIGFVMSTVHKRGRSALKREVFLEGTKLKAYGHRLINFRRGLGCHCRVCVWTEHTDFSL